MTHAELKAVHASPYVAALVLSKPSALGWRFYQCANCSATYWAEEVFGQKGIETVEKYCSEHCQQEHEAFLKADSCEHDWRGVDWGRMCFHCGARERMQ